jgi:hypothetical protein
MPAYSFRFSPASFRSAFAPRKPRHPLLRLAVGIVGLGLLSLLVFFGLFVGAAMLGTGLLYRLWKQRGKPIARQDHVVDGEYRVVAKGALPVSR